MSAGFAYLRADRPLRTLVLVVAVMVAFTNVSVIAELFLAEGTLHAGAAGYAALVTGWTAAMTVGTLVAGRLTSKLLRWRCCSHGGRRDRDRTGWALAPPVVGRCRLRHRGLR